MFTYFWCRNLSSFHLEDWQDRIKLDLEEIDSESVVSWFKLARHCFES
jgi:hypothetical protein